MPRLRGRSLRGAALRGVGASGAGVELAFERRGESLRLIVPAELSPQFLLYRPATPETIRRAALSLRSDPPDRLRAQRERWRRVMGKEPGWTLEFRGEDGPLSAVVGTGDPSRLVVREADLPPIAGIAFSTPPRPSPLARIWPWVGIGAVVVTLLSLGPYLFVALAGVCFVMGAAALWERRWRDAFGGAVGLIFFGAVGAAGSASAPGAWVAGLAGMGLSLLVTVPAVRAAARRDREG